MKMVHRRSIPSYFSKCQRVDSLCQRRSDVQNGGNDMSRKSKWILHEANNYDYIQLSII